MIDRLRSHLKSEKGFTLIELLVVIAIIAVLVVIAVIAINPIERINEGNDRSARANVRASGTLISTCITQSLATTGVGADDCENETEVEGLGDGNVPEGNDGTDDGIGEVIILTDAAAATNVCAYQRGRVGRWFLYSHATGTTEQLDQPAAPVAADCT